MDEERVSGEVGRVLGSVGFVTRMTPWMIWMPSRNSTKANFALEEAKRQGTGKLFWMWM